MCGVKNCVMYKIKFYVVVFRSHFVYRSHVISLAKKKHEIFNRENRFAFQLVEFSRITRRECESVF